MFKGNGGDDYLRWRMYLHGGQGDDHSRGGEGNDRMIEARAMM